MVSLKSSMLPSAVEYPASFCFNHLDHHVIGGLIDKRDQYILPIDHIGAVRILGGGSLGDFPDEVPGQYIRQSISKIFH